MLFIAESEVEKLLEFEELRLAMEEALIQFSAARVDQPLRTILRLPEYEGWFGLMPCVYGPVIGAKLVTVFPKNAELSIHTHNAIIVLFRTETGEPLAILEGRTITARRTAAVSAAATNQLAPPGSTPVGDFGKRSTGESTLRGSETSQAF